MEGADMPDLLSGGVNRPNLIIQKQSPLPYVIAALYFLLFALGLLDTFINIGFKEGALSLLDLASLGGTLLPVFMGLFLIIKPNKALLVSLIYALCYLLAELLYSVYMFRESDSDLLTYISTKEGWEYYIKLLYLLIYGAILILNIWWFSVHKKQLPID